MNGPIQFVVRRRKGKWLVQSNDLDRSFSLQHEAMSAAIDLANESGKNGKPSVVLLQKAKDQVAQIWKYGESPYPPSNSDLLAVEGATGATDSGR